MKTFNIKSLVFDSISILGKEIEVNFSKSHLEVSVTVKILPLSVLHSKLEGQKEKVV